MQGAGRTRHQAWQQRMAHRPTEGHSDGSAQKEVLGALQEWPFELLDVYCLAQLEHHLGDVLQCAPRDNITAALCIYL